MAYDRAKPAPNLVAYNLCGERVWTAQNLTQGSATDASVNFLLEEPLWVGNFEGFVCRIDAETGKILESVFTKIVGQTLPWSEWRRAALSRRFEGFWLADAIAHLFVMSDTVATPQSAKIAAKYARLPEVKRLFEELSRQHETLAAMQTEFIESIKRNRAMREGKAAKPSKPGKRTLEEFDRDAEKANEDIERLSQTMNDRALLTCELSGIQQMIQFDEGMLSAWHDDDKPMANSIINFQREMLKLLEDFIKNSSFNGQITSV